MRSTSDCTLRCLSSVAVLALTRGFVAMTTSARGRASDRPWRLLQSRGHRLCFEIREVEIGRRSDAVRQRLRRRLAIAGLSRANGGDEPGMSEYIVLAGDLHDLVERHRAAQAVDESRGDALDAALRRVRERLMRLIEELQRAARVVLQDESSSGVCLEHRRTCRI